MKDKNPNSVVLKVEKKQCFGCVGHEYTFRTHLDSMLLCSNYIKLYTLPETNIAPENGWLEDDFPFGAQPIFSCELLVSGRVDFEANSTKTPRNL